MLARNVMIMVQLRVPFGDLFVLGLLIFIAIYVLVRILSHRSKGHDHHRGNERGGVRDRAGVENEE